MKTRKTKQIVLSLTEKQLHDTITCLGLCINNRMGYMIGNYDPQVEPLLEANRLRLLQKLKSALAVI